MPAQLVVEEGSLQGLVFNLDEKEEWAIGRDFEICDLVVEDATVSRKHASLTKNEEGFWIKNLSKVNPLFLNGEELKEEAVLLKEGDLVQIGQQTFRFFSTAKEKKTKKNGYDDIFGDLEEPPPPRQEPLEIERQSSLDKDAETREDTRYDTIFEDVEGESEIPFNLLSSSPLLLKVISGPNSGAEIGLEKGRSYTIGKDPNLCDIVFQDLSVSRNHARLNISSEGEIELEDLGSKNGTLINGSIIQQRQIITPQDVVTLGTSLFLIIDREAPQETIYSPMLTPSYEQPRQETKEEAPLMAEASAAEAIDWKDKKIPTRQLVVAGSFVAIFLIVFLSFFSLFRSENLEIVQKEPVEQIKEALAKFSTVQFSFNPGSSKLFLVGHVGNGVEYQEMTYQIEQIPFIQSVENTVIIDELVCKSMNDVLAANSDWRGVSIQSPAPGKFIAFGYLQTNQEATQLWDYLTVNFSYLDRLQNQLVVQEVMQTQIQNLFASHGFGAVTFQLANGEVVLSGRYSHKRDSEYHELVHQLNQIQGVAKVSDYAMSVPEDAAGIDLSQQYQIGGTSLFDGSGYSVMLNGKVYTIGSMIDGMKITSIGQSLILLEKDGLKYKIEYTVR